MQPGSLVVPTIDYKDTLAEFPACVKIEPIIPEPNTIFTVKSLFSTEGFGPTIEVEETRVYSTDPSIFLVYGFNAEFWKEVQSPGEVNISALLKESEQIKIKEPQLVTK